MSLLPRRARGLLVEPPRPQRVRASQRAAWLAVSAVCVGAFMGQLDASIVTLALPTLRSAFRTDLGMVEWVSLAYLLVLVAGVVILGRVADLVGRKLLYTYGFAVFIGASLVCGLAPSLGVLVGARAIQAVGAAMLQANSVALVSESAPAGHLGRAIGLQGAAQALGLAAGPAVGGALIAAGGWRWIFLVNVPVGLLGLVMARVFVPRTRHLAKRRSLDWMGAALLVPAVSGVLVALSLGAHAGWGSPLIVAAWVVALAAAAAFVGRERRIAVPLVDLAMFRNRVLSRGIATALLAYAGLFGVLFVVPFFLELSHRRSALAAGLELTALPLALGLTAPFAGRLSDRSGPRLPATTGLTVAALAMVVLALAHGTDVAIVAELLLLGAGLGLYTPANNAAVMAAAPPRRAGVVGGLLNLARGLGMAGGIAVTGLVFTTAAGMAGASGFVHGLAHASRGLAAACLVLAAVTAAGAILSGSVRAVAPAA